MGFSIFGGEYAADEGDCVGRSFGQGNGALQQGEGFGEHLFAGGVEGGDGLAFFDASSEAGVEEDAGVRIDGFASFFAACAGALDGPADLGCIHLRDEAGIPCGEDGCGSGGMEVGVVVED